MSTTDIDICSGALVMIGAQPITGFNEASDEARACANLYTRTLRDCLSLYHWRFATGQQQLNRLEAAPPDSNKWSAAYQLPDTALAIRTVRVNGHPIEFDRYEDNIYCNATATDEVYLEAVYQVDEQFFPPYFIRLMELKMAALLAEALAAKTDLSNNFDQKAQRQMSLAKTKDAQGRTQVRFDTTRITRRRFRNGLRSEDYYG
jgi:hypothetical protein